MISKISRSQISILGLSVLLSAVALNVASCSKSSSDPAAVTTTSAFATIIAQELTVASPTSQAGGAGSSFNTLSSRSTVTSMAMPDADSTSEEKSAALVSLLSGPASCSIAITSTNSGRANCYGPSVSYTNHEFDNSNSSWPGGDLGIWESTEPGSSEACVAAQLTSQMRGAVSYVDMGQYITAGMACVASKNGMSPPDVGATLDLASSMAGVVTIDGSAVTVTTATIAREANDTSGNPVYVTSLVGTSGTKTFTVRLKHIPTTADDSTNKGKISVKVSNTGPAQTDGASLEYEKATSTTAKILLKTINSTNATYDPFESGSNKSVKISAGWNNNANYFLGNLDMSDKTGKFVYAWQAGSGDSHTRVFNLILASSGGAVTGTGFYGYGPTMAAGPGAISGMICAWTGPDQTHTPVNRVQRQDLALTGGKFDLTGTSYTVYDPVADCDAAGAMSMTWTTSSGASPRAVNSTTENLRPLAEVNTTIGTLPTAPANVDL